MIWVILLNLPLEEGKWIKDFKENGIKPYIGLTFGSSVVYKEKIYFYGGYSEEPWSPFYAFDTSKS